MKEIKYKPIGIVHSTFKEPKNVPIQAATLKPTLWVGVKSLLDTHKKSLQDQLENWLEE